jgi:hypothetical protein
VPIQPASAAPSTAEPETFGPGQQERQRDAGQRGVRDRIAEQALPAQHREHAERAADRPSAAAPSATVRSV